MGDHGEPCGRPLFMWKRRFAHLNAKLLSVQKSAMRVVSRGGHPWPLRTSPSLSTRVDGNAESVAERVGIAPAVSLGMIPALRAMTVIHRARRRSMPLPTVDRSPMGLQPL